MRDASYHQGLPIHKAAMDLAVAMDAAVREFSRHHKYGVGVELRRSTIDCSNAAGQHLFDWGVP